MTLPGGLGYSHGSEVCSVDWDTECCSIGRLTRSNQLKLAVLRRISAQIANIDELSRVRVPKKSVTERSLVVLQLNTTCLAD